jgi:hypothetical protein
LTREWGEKKKGRHSRPFLIAQTADYFLELSFDESAGAGVAGAGAAP